MTTFTEKIIKVVAKIPRGKVMSYGQVAAHIGSPRAARQVGGALRALDENIKIPWWRVVNNEGVISIKGSFFSKQDQKALLEKEGVEVRSDFTFDIEKYRFRIRP